MRKLIVAATSLALCGNMLAADKPTVEEEAALRVVAYTATLAKFVSTNSQAFVVALAPSIRGKWQTEGEKYLRVEGVQLFLPDFFKVAYVYNGGVVGDVFCFGLYNPFYDHMLLCKAKNVKRSEIVDYKWVSGSTLRGDATTPKYPPSTGVNPPDQYFPIMLKTMGDVVKSFNSKFVGPLPDDAFSALRGLDEAGFARLVDIAAFRTAQAVKMTGDKSAYGLATLAALVLREDKFSNQPFVGQNEMSLAVVRTVGKLPTDVRNAFRPIGYFEVEGEKCVVFYNSSMPTFLVLAHSKDGRVIQLGMFDANIANDWDKKINL